MTFTVEITNRSPRNQSRDPFLESFIDCKSHDLTREAVELTNRSPRNQSRDLQLISDSERGHVTGFEGCDW